MAVDILVPLLTFSDYEAGVYLEHDYHRPQRIDVDGDKIVYVLSKDGDDFLFLYDLVTKENKIISYRPHPSEVPTLRIPYPPAIHDGRVVYILSADDYSGIYLYDIQSGPPGGPLPYLPLRYHNCRHVLCTHERIEPVQFLTKQNLQIHPQTRPDCRKVVIQLSGTCSYLPLCTIHKTS